MQTQISPPSLDVPVDNDNWTKRFSEAFQDLERAADRCWYLVDECTDSYIAFQKASHNDVKESLKAMRKVHETSKVLGMLYKFIEDSTIELQYFKETAAELETHISQVALNYGLNLLPDEILTEILFHAAGRLKETISLSYVCKRFHSIISSQRKIWQKHKLYSSWSSKGILALAQRCGLNGLSGLICQNYDSSLSPSSRAILSLHPYLKHLEVSNLINSCVEEFGRILSNSEMPTLRTLTIYPLHKELPPSSHLFEVWDMPSLQILEVCFVPQSSSAKNLTRCSLHLNGKFCLKALLEFLSCAERLEELSIEASSSLSMVTDGDSARELRPVSITSLSSLKLRWWNPNPGQFLTEKICPSGIRHLELHALPGDFSVPLSFMLTSASIRDLHVRFAGFHGNVGEILATLSEHIEEVSVTSNMFINPFVTRRNPDLHLENIDLHKVFRAFNLQRLCFKLCSEITRKFVLSLCDFFMCIKHVTIKFIFEDCGGVRNGTFTLDTVESALLDEETGS